MGLGIARAYAREGARVVVNSRTEAECAALARELGPTVMPVAADLTRADDVRRLAVRPGRAVVVDILVNNAGKTVVAPTESWPRPTLLRPRANLTSIFLLTRPGGRCCPRPRRVIHAARSGRMPFPSAAYCVPKPAST
jgi:NAD(P)-dependent dehydrogenase (short-subunit alcohol dehydrogenase family)